MNTNNTFSYFLILLVLFICNPVISFAQNNQLRAYTLEDGLPQSQVYDIIQDDIGYLWLGTQGGGLCRFDGEEFKIWNENDGLASNYIISLAAANDSIFIGTKNGLTVKSKDKFINIEAPRVNKIKKIANKTYVATNIGIYEYHKKRGLVKINLNAKLNTSIINDIAHDGKLFWIATNKGLWKLNKLEKNARIKERHSAYHYTATTYDKNKIYAAALNKGILVLNTNARTYGNKWISRPTRVTNIAVHNKNELWISTDNTGVTILDTKRFKSKNSLSRKNGLVVSNIRKSISDRQSNIWIATSGGGFYKYFKNNFIHYDQDNGLKSNRVYAVHAINNEIWASNSEAGLIKIDSLGIEHIPQDRRLHEVKIKSITSDQNGNVWAGTEGKGVLIKEIKIVDSIARDTLKRGTLKKKPIIKIDTLKKRVITNHIINKKKGLVSNWVRAIEIVGNTIWVASHSSGITKFRYSFKKKKLIAVKRFTRKNGIKDLHIRDMKKDANGTIWYSTQSGDIGFIKKNRVKHLRNVLKQKTAIKNLLFSKNTIYIGTEGRGIWWADLNKKIVFKKLSGKKKPYSDNIYQMIFDSKNNLWAGSERGVDKIELNLLNQIVDVLHYGRNDGFLGIETFHNAVTKDSEGSLWFGAIYGLTKYQPTETIKTTIKPTVHFEDVEVAYQSVDSIHLSKWTDSDHVLELTPEQTELSLSFKTIDLNHPKDVQYRWKLNKSEWSPWSSEHKQNLAGMAYGSHYFTAQSRNYRWKESDPIVFKFFIDSPIYKKTWFQLLILALTVLILGGYGLSYIKRVKEKNFEESERLKMQNHLLSLEQKALRLQMNPHFIFNVLNGIKAMSISNPNRMNNTINTFAVLLRETLYNSRKDTITLDQEMQTLKHYIEIEKLMANKDFNYTITIDSDLDPEEILIPPMLIQPFVENAVRHGILKGTREGELSVKFHTNDEFLHCVVTDNGQGIFQSQKNKAKTDHQSMALTVTQERLESISGKDSLQIKELKARNRTIAGTEIAFKIPLETDY